MSDEAEGYEDNTPTYDSISGIADLQRIASLMHIIEKGQSMPTDANYIVGEARLELRAINEDCKTNSIARNEANRLAEAEAAQARQLELQAANEASAEKPVEEGGVIEPAVGLRRS